MLVKDNVLGLGTAPQLELPACCGALWGPQTSSRGRSRRVDHLQASWSHSRPAALVSQPRKGRVITCAALNRGEGPPNKMNERKKHMLKYVKEVDPQGAQQFIKQSNTLVVSAMKHTVTNIVGTLPPQLFEVVINTSADSLAQLMFNVMMTGYMLRSAQFRLELQSSVAALPAVSSASSPSSRLAAAAPASSSGGSSSSSATALLGPGRSSPGSGSSSEASSSSSSSGSTCGSSSGNSSSSSFLVSDKYAPGVQKTKVQGEVLRWHLDNGLERLPATQYMAMLEEEVARLRDQLSQQQQQREGPMNPKSAADQAASELEKGLDGAPVDANAYMPDASTPTAITTYRNGSRLPGSSAGHSIVLAAAAAGAAGAMAAGGLGAAAQVGATGLVGGLNRSNALLNYLHTLAPAQLGELTGMASRDVMEAMDAFIARLMGSSDPNHLRRMTSEFSAAELSKVLFWLMVVGYTLRTMEVKYELCASMEVTMDPEPGSGSGSGSSSSSDGGPEGPAGGPSGSGSRGGGKGPAGPGNGISTW